jgi:hypothetical protein
VVRLLALASCRSTRRVRRSGTIIYTLFFSLTTENQPSQYYLFFQNKLTPAKRIGSFGCFSLSLSLYIYIYEVCYGTQYCYLPQDFFLKEILQDLSHFICNVPYQRNNVSCRVLASRVEQLGNLAKAMHDALYTGSRLDQNDAVAFKISVRRLRYGTM